MTCRGKQRVSARPPTLSVMLSIAHTAQKREPLAYTRDIVLLCILRPSFSKGFPFAARKREMQIVNTDYPLLEFGQRHFSRKNITCSLSRGEFTFKVPPRGKKAAPGENFRRLQANLHTPSMHSGAVCAIGWPRRGMLLMCDAHRLVCCALRRNEMLRDAHSPKASE